jgi:hypothetical protein
VGVAHRGVGDQHALLLGQPLLAKVLNALGVQDVLGGLGLQRGRGAGSGGSSRGSGQRGHRVRGEGLVHRDGGELAVLRSLAQHHLVGQVLGQLGERRPGLHCAVSCALVAGSRGNLGSLHRLRPLSAVQHGEGAELAVLAVALLHQLLRRKRQQSLQRSAHERRDAGAQLGEALKGLPGRVALLLPNDLVHDAQRLQLVRVDALRGGQLLAVLGELLQLVLLVFVPAQDGGGTLG